MEEKDDFYDQIMSVIVAVSDDEMLLIGGDFNGHVGEHSLGFEDAHGGNGFGTQNPDGVRLLDFCVANKLAISNTFLKKQSHNLFFRRE